MKIVSYFFVLFCYPLFVVHGKKTKDNGLHNATKMHIILMDGTHFPQILVDEPIHFASSAEHHR
jgi:hypothetical protein